MKNSPKSVSRYAELSSSKNSDKGPSLHNSSRKDECRKARKMTISCIQAESMTSDDTNSSFKNKVYFNMASKAQIAVDRI
jgi:hypothetical protein